MILVVIIADNYRDKEVKDTVEDNLTDSEIVRFLNNKYGSNVWMAYNKEFE